jgi:hypothetical protein
MKRFPKVNLFFAWYDFWIGWFYDKNKNVLYICPLPMVVLKLDFGIRFMGIDYSNGIDKTVSVEGRMSEDGNIYVQEININDLTQ